MFLYFRALSVGENSLQNNIIIYPNPANDFLNIRFDNPQNQNEQIIIYDIYGKAIFKSIIPSGTGNFTIDIRTFSQGIYLIHANGINSRFIKVN